MPRLAERATGTLGHLAPKAAGLLSVAGFAAAGVVSVVADNLRTLADRDEALPDRAKQVAQHSIGAVLAGPGALSARGRQLVGRPRPDSAKTTAKTVAPAERPDRSKAEEARDRDADADEVVTAGGKPAEEEPQARKKPTAKKTPAKKTTAKKTTAKKPTAKKTTAKKPTAKKTTAKKKAAKKTAAPATGTADPNRSVEEQRAEQRTARKQAAKKAAKTSTSGNGQDAPATPDGLPDGVDEQLVADLQRMTVEQLRDRAASDGVPGRDDMSKDELVVALATRETDDVPAKA